MYLSEVGRNEVGRKLNHATSLRFAARLRGAVCAAAVILCIGAQATTAYAAQRTTLPAVATRVPVTLTSRAIKITPDQYTSNGKSEYPRGAVIDFFFTNTGNKAVSVRIKLVGKINFAGHNSIATYTSAGEPIKPGYRRHFKVNFFFRSTFSMQMLSGGKVVASTPITII